MFVKLIVLVGLLTVAVAFGARTSNGAGNGESYVVRAGDTLWSVAATHYGGDVREAVWRVRERNHLDGVLLHPGQRITLP
jgi:nucleoid-associated protein YgaU